MKKLIGLLLLVALFSCEKQHCRKCQTQYIPGIIPPRTFVVCSDEEFNYWNGRTVQYVQDGNTVIATTVCKWNNYRRY